MKRRPSRREGAQAPSFLLCGDSRRVGGLFSWLSVGNLRNRGNFGPFYVNGNNGTGNARWNICSRLSGASRQQIYFRRVYPAHFGATGLARLN